MQFFQRKLGVASVIKIYFKMWELFMHSDYDYLCISFTSKKNANSSHKPIFLLGITTFFLLTLLLCGSKFLKKNIYFFWFEISLQQASKQKENYFIIKKILQNFEGHDHWQSNIGHLVSTQGDFQIKLPLILILQMKQQFSVMFQL